MLNKKKVAVAFLAGADGALLLTIYGFLVKMPQIPDTRNFLLLFLFFIIVAGIVEEGLKFLLISRWGQFPSYAVFLGLGYGFFEQYFRNGMMFISEKGFNCILTSSFWLKPSAGFVMQTLFAIIIAYFIARTGVNSCDFIAWVYGRGAVY